MTVEEYLRSLVPGLDLQTNVIERAALSPIEAMFLYSDGTKVSAGLDALELDDEDDSESLAEEEFRMRLDYASSTVYYSVLGVFAGGGFTEQVGDVRKSRGGFIVTKDDRARYKSLADELREKWGFVITDEETGNEMFDASYLVR